MALRVVFLGTGEFALPAFRSLSESRHQVVGLVTQPDRTGRGHHLHVNRLKELAGQRGTPVFQPEKANLPESLEQLRAFNADLFVVAAYGQILSAALLGIPRLGAINLHASLLPKYRGAAPIQYALLSGETETGVTLFQIEPKLDAGPILGVVKTPIEESETSGELQTRLAELAVPLTLRVLDELEAGTTTPWMQDVSQVTRAPKLGKEQGEIPWDKSAWLVHCHIRGVQPWPRPGTTLKLVTGASIRLLVLKTGVTQHSVPGPPGTLEVQGRRLFVKTGGDGAVEVLQMQSEGKRPMTPAEFLNGTPITTGARFLLPGEATQSEEAATGAVQP